MTGKFFDLSLVIIFFLLFGLLVYISPPKATLAQSCPVGTTNPIRIENGFFTDPNQGGRVSNAYSIIALPNVTPYCIADPKATIPQFSIMNYPEMKSLYFDQFPYSQYKKTMVDPTSGSQINTDLNNPLYDSHPYRLYIVQNLSINSASDNIAIASPPGKPVVIFVNGTLTFNADFAGSGYGPGSDSRGGVVFIVAGDVNVNPAVDTINAVIITSGTFCSAYDGIECPSSLITSSTLTINGSIVSLDGTSDDNGNGLSSPADPSDDPPQPPKFVRNLALNNTTTPAEAVNFDPKYIVIFRDIFSRDLTIWNEIQ